MKKQPTISWVSKEVNISAIAPTPQNYKIKTALGKQRLQASLKSFGLAGNVVCNYAGKFGDITKLVLIDGNSRREEAIEAGQKKIWVSLPSRLLSAVEFKEMSAMFDFAKAGEIDMDRIEKDLGTSKKFYEKYHLEPPMELLAGMGANAPKGPKLKTTETEVPLVEPDERVVQLFYNIKQEKQFRAMEDKVKVKFKSISTSDTIFKALKFICK